MTGYLITIVEILGSLSVLITSIYAFMVYRIHRHSHWVWLTTAIACTFVASAVSTYPFSSVANVPLIMIPLGFFALSAGISFLIAARELLADVTPSAAAAAAAAAGGEEISLLRDDIFAVRGYVALTNTFLVIVKSAVDDKLLKDVLTKHFEYNPILFEGCEIKDDGAITTESIVKNLDGIHRENRVQLLCSMFSALNTKIMNLYGAVTSPDMAKKAFGVSYLTVKKQYGDSPIFFEILRSLPEGVLEEARISLLGRDELELAVRERTAELEKERAGLEKKIKERTAELRTSEQKFKDLTETTTDWIWEVNKDGIYTYTSPKVKELLGYEVNEVIGRTPFNLMPKDEAKKIAKFFKEKAVKKEPFFGLENINRHKDGHLVLLETNGIPIFDEKGQLKGYRGIDRDITGRKRMKKRLK